MSTFSQWSPGQSIMVLSDLAQQRAIALITLLSFRERTGSMEISRNCWGWGGRIGFKLQGNCTCCRTKAINNPSNLFQTHGPGLLPSTLLGTFPFIQARSLCWASGEFPESFEAEWLVGLQILHSALTLRNSNPCAEPNWVKSEGPHGGTLQWLEKTCCWESQHRSDDLALKTIWKERLQNCVWAMWAGLQQLWRSQPSLYLCSVHLKKISFNSFYF